jgi:hypothetical protein
VATIVVFVMVTMFRRRDPKKLDKRVNELSRGVVVLLGRSVKGKSYWMS